MEDNNKSITLTGTQFETIQSQQSQIAALERELEVVRGMHNQLLRMLTIDGSVNPNEYVPASVERTIDGASTLTLTKREV